MAAALFTHPVFQKHNMGAGHPERPERLQAFDVVLDEHSDLKSQLLMVDPPEASYEQVARVHAKDYIDMILDASPQSGMISLNPDTSMNEFSLEATSRGAGAAVKAAEMVHAGEARHAFCAVRPCGHHATRDQSMGFCIYNGIAVGAAHALDALGLERVAVLDFDVHHGNGTEDIFENDPRVLFASSFQHPYYPHTNPVSTIDHIIKSPISAGQGSEAFRKAVTDTWIPALEKFKPQMIFISAGFDAHEADPLGQLRFTEDDYVWFTEEMIKLADKHCPGQIVSYLEGGYDLGATARSAIAHLDVLANQ